MVFIGRVFDCIQPVALEVECSIPENCVTQVIRKLTQDYI